MVSIKIEIWEFWQILFFLEPFSIAFIQTKIDENITKKDYASAAENQSILTNLENWNKELQIAVEEKRYADASSLDGKIKKVYPNLNFKSDIKEPLTSYLIYDKNWKKLMISKLIIMN